MPGKNRGSRYKERPLLAVSGVLKLERSFVAEDHTDAEKVLIQVGDKSTEIRLAPSGQSEHESVRYMSGYSDQVDKELRQSNPIQTDHSTGDFKIMVSDLPPEEKQREALQEYSRKPRQQYNELYHQDTNEITATSFGMKDFTNNAPVSSDDRTSGGDKILERHPSLDSINSDENDSVENMPPNTQTRHKRKHENESVSDKLESRDVTETPSSEKRPKESATDMAFDVAKSQGQKRREEARNTLVASANNKKSVDKEELVMCLNELEHAGEEESLRQKTKSVSKLITNNKIQSMPGVKGSDETNVTEASPHTSTYQQTLSAYWSVVKKDPMDFNTWTSLIDLVEMNGELSSIRSAYNAFLPLYPYCYAYWIRYADLESKFSANDGGPSAASSGTSRSLAILHRSLKALPMSIDLWLSYLKLYKRIYSEKHADFITLFRDQCERALDTVGLDLASADPLWTFYMDWLTSDVKDLRSVTSVYQRVIGIPTRLYNKHWDNFVVHVRDHHPRDILPYEEYDQLRRRTCRELNLVYRPDNVGLDFENENGVENNNSSNREVVRPEDRLKVGMKERLVASLVTLHEKTEKEVESRLQFESKLKRTYFHVKPLDLKQIKVWHSYLDYEISLAGPSTPSSSSSSSNHPPTQAALSCHRRIVVLFERCLVPCANYEVFWIRYSRYLETYHRDQMKLLSSVESVTQCSKKSEDVMVITDKNKQDDVVNSKVTGSPKEGEQKKEGEVVVKCASPKTEDEQKINVDNESVSKDEKIIDAESKTHEVIDEKVDVSSTTKDDIKRVNGVAADTVQAIRSVYRRACLVHCTSKIKIRLKWAQFEECVGKVTDAVNILNECITKYPLLLEANLQLIDVYRRQSQLSKAEELYRKLLKKIPPNKTSIRTWLSTKFARFQLKVCNCPERALAILRQASKKDRSNPTPFSYVIETCYQRSPIDCDGVAAATELAILNPDLSLEKRLEFVKRKVEFVQEFGTIDQLRSAEDQLVDFERQIRNERRTQALSDDHVDVDPNKLDPVDVAEFKEYKKIKREVLRRMGKSGDESNMDKVGMKIVEKINAKSVVSSSTPSSTCKRCQGELSSPKNKSNPPNKQSANERERHEVSDLLEMSISAEQEARIRKKLDEKTKFKEVAPTWELNIDYRFDRGRNKDYEHVDRVKFREYERLESSGYNKIGNGNGKNENGINGGEPFEQDSWIEGRGGGIGLGGGSNNDNNQDGRVDMNRPMNDYVIPPQAPQLAMPGRGFIPRTSTGGPLSNKGDLMKSTGPFNQIVKNSVLPHDFSAPPPISLSQVEFTLPPEIGDINSVPHVNVPDWFLADGGRLVLSEKMPSMGNEGVPTTSSIRYWPSFLSAKGNALMFARLRKYCKWHQKQHRFYTSPAAALGGAHEGEGVRWKNVNRLLAWFGPCAYRHMGLDFHANMNWSPEMLDLLKRLTALTSLDFNSCMLSLFRNGRDYTDWAEQRGSVLFHRQSVSSSNPSAALFPSEMGRFPTVAILTVGNPRVVEFRIRESTVAAMGGPAPGFPQYLRFPLLSGSLLVFEGAFHEDWMFTVSQNSRVCDETIQLSYRTMFAVPPSISQEHQQDQQQIHPP